MFKKIIFSALASATILLPVATLAGAKPINTFGVGIEGFKDQYREDTTDTTVDSDYGSITGYFSQQRGRAFFSFDGRVSYGSGDYEANNGTFYDAPRGELEGVNQWEIELRGRFGITTPLWGGSLSPYLGLGVRHHRYEAKGFITSGGDIAYDKISTQAYIPIGASLAFESGDGWTITPQAEADIMVYGTVDSRLTTLWGHNYGSGPQFLDTSDNKQKLGLGGRGELMFGKAMDGYSLQFGPFIRYWYFGKSNTSNYVEVNTNTPFPVEEPSNTITQVGLKARVLW